MKRWIPAVTAATTLLVIRVAAGQTLLGPTVTDDVPGTAGRCALLNRIDLPELVSIDALPVPAGPFQVPAFGPFPESTVALPAFCRLSGTIAPAIDFEVWLPYESDWNGRFQAVGGGGFAGVISHGAMVEALNGGYVTASTDTGHDADDLDWLSDPRRLRDYGYRAIFEMTAKAKAAIKAFYDRPADFNYFNGCSTGGRQGLMEAQRFPADYDGIVSGAPVNYFVDTTVAQLWTARATQPVSDDPMLSQRDLDLVNDAALARCDTLDGVQDGIIGDPLGCSFDPGVLQCSATSSGQCLARPQIEAIRQIYAGPADPATGDAIHPGFPPGSEASWQLAITPGLMSIPREFYSRSIFGDPAWDWHSFDLAADVELTRDQAGPILDATDPDLSEFREQGGKLIVYHGWNDQLILPGASIQYYEAVDAARSEQTQGRESANDFFRLFMVPGMTHCAGGPGTDSFDVQSAIENWVERGIAPDRIEASHLENGRTQFSRPLCPYPLKARYRGTGDQDQAANFVCVR